MFKGSMGDLITNLIVGGVIALASATGTWLLTLERKIASNEALAIEKYATKDDLKELKDWFRVEITDLKQFFKDN